MEYERFFHFGNIDNAAKWYLLTSSNAVPQRLLCKKEYAEKNNYPHFGNFTFIDIKGKLINYTYIIENVYNIPINALSNFYTLTCDSFDKKIQSPSTSFDIDFEREFSSAQDKTIPNIIFNTNQTTLATNYLQGIENLTTVQLPLNMNIISEDTVQKCQQQKCMSPGRGDVTSIRIVKSDNEQQQQSQQELQQRQQQQQQQLQQLQQELQRQQQQQQQQQQQVSTKRRITDDTPGPSQPKQREVLRDDTSCIDEMCEEMDTQSLDLNTTLPMDFPSMSYQDDVIDNYFSPEVIQKFKNELISDVIKSNYFMFGTRYNTKLIINGDKIELVNLATNSIATTTVTLDRNIININNENLGYLTLIPTLLDNVLEDTIINGLIETDGSQFPKFMKFKEKHIDNINAFLNDAPLSEIINVDLKIYNLLAGLRKFMRENDISKYSKLTILTACKIYGNSELTRISELLIRVYLQENHVISKLNPYFCNYHHLRNAYLDDTSVDILTDKMTNDFPSIEQLNNFNIEINNGFVVKQLTFGHNIFAIDNNILYLSDLKNNDIYLVFERVFDDNEVSSTLITKYNDKSKYGIWPNKDYKGLIKGLTTIK